MAVHYVSFLSSQAIIFPRLFILNFIGNKRVPFNSVQFLPAQWNFITNVSPNVQGVVFGRKVLVRMKTEMLPVIISFVCSFNLVLYLSSLKTFYF